MSKYVERLELILSKNADAFRLGVDFLTRKIVDISNQNGSVYIIGNGGSASTANHFETDLSFVRAESQSISMKISSLASNESLLTAVANDLDYEEVFARPILRKGRKGDLLIVISASGNSVNLIRAVECARSIGIDTYGILGFDGGQLLGQCDQSLLLCSQIGDYGPVEDAQLAFCHAVSEEIKQTFGK